MRAHLEARPIDGFRFLNYWSGRYSWLQRFRVGKGNLSMLTYTLPSAQYPTLILHYVIDSKRLKYTTQQQNTQYCRSECAAHRWQHHPHLRATRRPVISWSRPKVRRSASRPETFSKFFMPLIKAIVSLVMLLNISPHRSEFSFSSNGR